MLYNACPRRLVFETQVIIKMTQGIKCSSHRSLVVNTYRNITVDNSRLEIKVGFANSGMYPFGGERIPRRSSVGIVPVLVQYGLSLTRLSCHGCNYGIFMC